MKQLTRGNRRRTEAAGWLSAMVARRRSCERDRHRLRPAALLLEDRRLLSTFNVISTADDGSTGTLRWAVGQANAATSPSTIDFQLGGGTQTITLTLGQLELSNTSAAIAIDGPGADLLTISGNDASRVFQVDFGVTASISGLTISGGSATKGDGGGVYNHGTVSLSDCTISGDTSSDSGGGLANDGTATLTGCTISDDHAGFVGDGLTNYGPLTLADCTITGNSGNGSSGGANGAGMFNRGGTATLNNCTISGNSAVGGGGGALYNRGTAYFTSCTLSDNYAGGGGAVRNYGGYSITFTDCTISGNSTPSDGSGGGGGLVNAGQATLTGCMIDDNVGGNGWGGGLANLSTGTTTPTLTLTNCTISGNSADNGGGVANYRLGTTTPTVTLANCTISGNSARSGGGLANNSTANLTGCTLSGNSALGGAGLFDSGTANLTSCTLSGNSATVDGGGLENWVGTATLIACTISGNSASGGGGLYNSALGLGYTIDVALTDTIVAGNSGTTGDGTSSDIGGDGASNVTGSYNLIGIGGSGGIAGGSDGNIVLSSLADLGLAPLGNYGGPTRTMGLLIGSPAIGAGTAISGVTTDQRGQPLDTPNPDIGAFQGIAPASLSFSGLSSPSITFGTPSVTISGTLADGTQTAQGETVTITLDGVSQPATIGSDGSFSATFGTSALGASGSPYTVGYSYAGDATYGPATDASTLTVTPATPKVSVSDAGGTFTGQSFAATASVAGVTGTGAANLEGVTPSLTYYAGTSATGTPLPGAPSQGGTYTVVAAFPGSADYKTAQSTATFTIRPAAAALDMTFSASSFVYGQPVTIVAAAIGPGSNVAPGGTVTFYVAVGSNGGLTAGPLLGTAPVDASGQATLTTSDIQYVGNVPIVAQYSGDNDLAPATAAPAWITITTAQVQPTVLPAQPVFNARKQLQSVILTVELEPTIPGASPPTGTVFFEQTPPTKHGKPQPKRAKVLGKSVLQGGTAAVSLSAKKVLNKSITIFYDGVAYQEVLLTLPTVTLRTLKGLAR